MAMKNGDLPIENGDLPIENGDLPIENGDLPIENCDFPSFFVCLPEGNITIAIELQRLYNLVGGWAIPLRNDGVRQLGIWPSQYMEK